jgi:N-formylglutamate amidohydrolase
MGLVRRLAKPNVPVYSRHLTVSDVESRIARYYRPYHEALETALDRLHRKFGVVWLINCHSMPARGSAMSSDGPGAIRADFVLGDRDGTTCAPEFTEFVAGFLRGLGYDVRVNEGYKGVEIVRRQGRPSEHRHSLQIEIDRSLYIDQKTLEKLPGFDRLRSELAGLSEALAGFVAERIAAL